MNTVIYTLPIHPCALTLGHWLQQSSWCYSLESLFSLALLARHIVHPGIVRPNKYAKYGGNGLEAHVIGCL